MRLCEEASHVCEYCHLDQKPLEHYFYVLLITERTISATAVEEYKFFSPVRTFYVTMYLQLCRPLTAELPGTKKPMPNGF